PVTGDGAFTFDQHRLLNRLFMGGRRNAAYAPGCSSSLPGPFRKRFCLPSAAIDKLLQHRRCEPRCPPRTVSHVQVFDEAPSQELPDIGFTNPEHPGSLPNCEKLG